LSLVKWSRRLVCHRLVDVTLVRPGGHYNAGRLAEYVRNHRLREALSNSLLPYQAG
jgi:hypothetical protein